jgi:hypothetical protein
MHGAMIRAREAAEHALDAQQKIMGNVMRTPVANMREARKVTFDHFEQAAKKIDAARDRAEREVARIEAETSAPPEPKHVSGTMLEAEIRSALAAMKSEARTAALIAAVEKGDDQTLGAALRGPTLLTGLSEAEREALRLKWRQKHFPGERIAEKRSSEGGLAGLREVCRVLCQPSEKELVAEGQDNGACKQADDTRVEKTADGTYENDKRGNVDTAAQ